ncbi:cupredoxin domain-containing protein [Paenibacillus turpanensis]|uniref:cupredoxin domain-containing protein n=1 Tax=Paenibacillus turpanensis TaxID=2689078 RepID=UPI001FB5A145|nr:cupredoxin domain-containing protein [Paenibacillus turpanensis]
MSRVFILRKKHVITYSLAMLFIAAASLVYWKGAYSEPVDGAPDNPRAIHLVTGEYKSTLPDGKEIESYRWDPGTIHVKEGETVKLHILGVNGEMHSFYIEGTTIKGEVKKGKETVVTFKGEKEGVYRIICVQHPDASHSGPMIGYIVVD